MGTKKFIIVFAISFVVYFISDYFFTNSAMYLLGGAIWGASKSISLNLGIIIGLVIMLGCVVLFFQSRNKLLRFLLLFVLAILLYVLDFVLLELVSYDSEIEGKIILDSTFKSNMFLIFRILYKSLILSLIIHSEGKRKL